MKGVDKIVKRLALLLWLWLWLSTSQLARADRALAEANGWIYNDFSKAVATASETGRPLLVVLRCPP